ncbi:unnamed protein product [Angiostrongylus costaricensis]|uniref:Uncharacterized protein n=1 Tax=Angiostrongylus costaricensis TaxID=334426 RepID=A0A0R3PPU3_ANGCS|nr:unnamed protein product [Angiostrongylus costaricensis]
MPIWASQINPVEEQNEEPGRCGGEVVVNKHFNGTIIANCLQLHDGDQFTEGSAICNRSQYRTSCACTTKNHCNSPTSPIADFRFVDEPILEGYQLTPLISMGGESLGGQYQFFEWLRYFARRRTAIWKSTDVRHLLSPFKNDSSVNSCTTGDDS